MVVGMQSTHDVHVKKLFVPKSKKAFSLILVCTNAGKEHGFEIQ